ncbi:MAG TPA: hypothetical protein VK149_11785 [Sideroxyarcus sp.]|nr:hypothetical protein [Sideroxyarcus sp.]
MKSKSLAIVFGGLLGFSVASQAAGLFVGGGLGVIAYPNWTDKLTSGALAAGATFAATDQEASGVGAGIRVGQWVSDNLGWEVGYSDLGSVTGHTGATFAGTAEMGTWKFSATAAHLAMLGGVKFNRSSLFGKIGVHSSSTKLEGDYVVGNGTYSRSASGTGLLIGGGYIFPFTENLYGRAAIDIFNGVKFTDPLVFANSTKETLTKISFGLDYRF